MKRECPKCGEADNSIRYCKATKECRPYNMSWWESGKPHGEILHIHCWVCQYDWEGPTIDKEK